MLMVFLRKFALLALVGFLVVLLVGPVLGILGIMFGFAVVGLLFWIPVRAFLLGQPPDWASYRDLTRKCRGAVFVRFCHAWRRGHDVLGHAQEVSQRAWATGCYVANILREIICGMLVGALIGWMHGSPSGWPVEQSVVLGIMAGAAIGVLVGIASRRPVRQVS
jgi:hypothetical protein